MCWSSVGFVRLKVLCLLVGQRLIEGCDGRTFRWAGEDVECGSCGCGGKIESRIGEVVEEAVGDQGRGWWFGVVHG